jgi:hypothetical protein
MAHIYSTNHFRYEKSEDSDMSSLFSLMRGGYYFKEYVSGEDIVKHPFHAWTFVKGQIRFYWEDENNDHIDLGTYLSAIINVSCSVGSEQIMGISSGVYHGTSSTTHLFVTSNNHVILNGEDVTDHFLLNEGERLEVVTEKYALTSDNRVFIWLLQGVENGAELYISPTWYQGPFSDDTIPTIVMPVNGVYSYPIEITDKLPLDIGEIVINIMGDNQDDRAYLLTNKSRLLAYNTISGETVDKTPQFELREGETFQNVVLYNYSVLAQTNQNRNILASMNIIKNRELTYIAEGISVKTFSWSCILGDDGNIYNYSDGTLIDFSNLLYSDERFIGMNSNLGLTNKGRLFDIRINETPTLFSLEGIKGNVISIDSRGSILTDTNRVFNFNNTTQSWVEDMTFTYLILMND